MDDENLGTETATNLQGSLSGPGGFTGFDSVHDFGALSAGGLGSGTFVFGLDGVSGETVFLDLLLTADLLAPV